MCFKVSTPEPRPVPKVPTRGDEALKSASNARRTASEQPGLYGNVFTSALGDSNYGENAKKVAKLGAASA